MRKIATVLLALVLGLSLATAVRAYDPPAPPPGSGINGTVHDLGTAHNGMSYVAIPPDFGSSATALNRICIFCHAPHNTYRLSPANLGAPGGTGPQAPDAYDYLPLWNHELTGNFVYSMYWNGPGAPTSGAKASQAIQNGMQMGSVSLLCMSCHDGSVAVNSYGNTDQPITSQSGTGATISTAYSVGRDNNMQNHHPIGFNYDDVQAVDTEIASADTRSFTATDTVRDHLYGAGNTQLECASCHSVHNTGNSGESLLWRSDVNSELCLTCHMKGTYTLP